MGRYTPIILLAVAVVIALATSIATYQWLQGKREAPAIETVETVPVAVALIDLPVGGVIQKEMIKTVSFMKGSLPGGSYFSDPEQVAGRVVYSPVRANEPVLLSRLAPENISEGGVPAVIKDKKRAMSVKVDQIIGVSGFIKPGDRVDVLVTLNDPDEEGPITKIVLENMLVLATGTQVQTGQQGAQATPVNVITLEVTPEEAEKISLATSHGRIQLALRGYQDDEEVFTKGAKIADLLASYRIGVAARSAQVFKETKVEKPVAMAPRPAPVTTGSRSYTVWTINGSAVQASKIK